MGEMTGQNAQTNDIHFIHPSGSRLIRCALVAGVLACLVPLLRAQLTIVEQPESVVVTHGQRVTLRVVAEGTSRIRYRWVFNDRYLATRRTTLSFRAIPRRAGVYRAVVVDREGNYAFSSPAQVEVLPRGTPSPMDPPPAPAPGGTRPVIVVQPENVTVREHDTGVFKVTLNNSGPYTTIIWHNDNPLEGSHQIPDGLGFDVRSTRLAIPNCLNADNYNGLYWIAVTNAAGGTVSRKVRLTVLPAP